MPVFLNFVTGSACERRSAMYRNQDPVVRPTRTIADFQDALRIRSERMRRALLGASLALAALWLLGWAAWGWLPPLLVEFDGGRTAHLAIAVLVPLALLVIALSSFGAWYSERQVRLDPRLSCPECRGPLDTLAPLVIATRTCPHCGVPVLAD